MHWLSSLRNYFYACDVSSENKTWVFFPPEKPQMSDGRWWPVTEWVTSRMTHIEQNQRLIWICIKALDGTAKKSSRLKKWRVPPLAPGMKESVDKCTKKTEIQSQKWQHEIANMYNFVRKHSWHHPQKWIIQFHSYGIHIESTPRVNLTLWDRTSGKKSDTTVFNPSPFFIAFLDISRCPAPPGKLFFWFPPFLTDLPFQEGSKNWVSNQPLNRFGPSFA
jgi:hypothetical protein